MPFKHLSKKVVTLFLVCTACRISVLNRLTIDNVHDLGDKFHIMPHGYDKTGSFTQPAQTLYLNKFSEKCLCPYEALKVYLERRPHHDSNKVFISLTKSLPATQNELSGWVSDIMKLAGVADNFRPHSIRGAVTSKAQGTLPTAVILEAANWAGYETFKKFYFRPIEDTFISSQRKQFQSAVLD